MEYKPQPDRYTNGMLYRRCGDSGIQLPVISLGFWHNFGNTDCYATGLELVEYAFDHGVCHFDLANNYGPPAGSAEENFGRMMKQSFAAHRDEMFITSKAGHEMWPGPYGGCSSRKNLMASIDQSLKRMNLDYVDLFYSHRYDGITPIDETMQALVDIVRQGKALYIGLSKYPVDKLLYALNYLHDCRRSVFGLSRSLQHVRPSHRKRTPANLYGKRHRGSGILPVGTRHTQFQISERHTGRFTSSPSRRLLETIRCHSG